MRIRSRLIWSCLIALGCAALQNTIPPPQAASEPQVATAVTPFDSLASEYERSGQLQVMVRYDRPGDPQSIQGYLHLGRVQSMRLTQAGADQADLGAGDQLRQMDALIDALDNFTQIKADFASTLTYSDPRLFELPIVVPQTRPNETETAQLTRYLLEGGFILGLSTKFADYREGLEKYGHLVWGQDVWTEYLSEDHPLFSAYFKIKGGAPRSDQQTQPGRPPVERLNGLVVKGRLAGVEFEMPQPNRRVERIEDTGRLQLAVNIVVYALTQEGSLTQRLMQRLQ